MCVNNNNNNYNNNKIKSQHYTMKLWASLEKKSEIHTTKFAIAPLNP